MEKKLKFVRMAALLGAVSGAAMFLGLASTMASAGEQRLHGEFIATYALIPLSEGSGGNRADASKDIKTANAGTSRAKKDIQTANAGTSRAKKDKAQPDEPRIEDPPLPSFDGGNGEGAQSMGSDASKSRGKNG